MLFFEDSCKAFTMNSPLVATMQKSRVKTFCALSPEELICQAALICYITCLIFPTGGDREDKMFLSHFLIAHSNTNRYETVLHWINQNQSSISLIVYGYRTRVTLSNTHTHTHTHLNIYKYITGTTSSLPRIICAIHKWNSWLSWLYFLVPTSHPLYLISFDWDCLTNHRWIMVQETLIYGHTFL